MDEYPLRAQLGHSEPGAQIQKADVWRNGLGEPYVESDTLNVFPPVLCGCGKPTDRSFAAHRDKSGKADRQALAPKKQRRPMVRCHLSRATVPRGVIPATGRAGNAAGRSWERVADNAAKTCTRFGEPGPTLARLARENVAKSGPSRRDNRGTNGW